MTEHDYPALRAALGALERECPMPPRLVENALADARHRAAAEAVGRTGARADRHLPRWLPAAAAALVVALVAVALVLARTGRQASPSSPPGVDTSGWQTYRSSTVSVRHPRSWLAQPLKETGTFLTGIVSLSNAHVPAACITNGNTIRCGPPVTPLDDGQVLITWTLASSARTASQPPVIESAQGRPTQIGGRPAKIAITPPDNACRQSRGERTITVTIEINRPGVAVMNACLSAADKTQLTTLTSTTIASARTARIRP